MFHLGSYLQERYENGLYTDGYHRYHICFHIFLSDLDSNTDNVNHVG